MLQMAKNSPRQKKTGEQNNIRPLHTERFVLKWFDFQKILSFQVMSGELDPAIGSATWTEMIFICTKCINVLLVLTVTLKAILGWELSDNLRHEIHCAAGCAGCVARHFRAGIRWRCADRHRWDDDACVVVSGGQWWSVPTCANFFDAQKIPKTQVVKSVRQCKGINTDQYWT